MYINELRTREYFLREQQLTKALERRRLARERLGTGRSGRPAARSGR